MAQQHSTELRNKTQQRKEIQDTHPVAAQPLQPQFHRIQQLQRILGNRQVAKLIQAKRLTPEGKIIGLQPKLTVGAADDQYEQEADRVANQVMAMPDAEVTAAAQQNPLLSIQKDQSLQTKPLAASITPVAQRQTEKEPEVEEDQDRDEEKDLLVQAKLSAASVAPSLNKQDISAEGEDTNPIQLKTDKSLSGSFDAGNDIETQLSLSKGRGSPLPETVRNYMEPRFGADFSQVRVHTGSESLQMNQAVGAQAFTHGADIYYGDGRSPTNLELTAHELTHVVQQTGSPPLKRKKWKNGVAAAASEPSIQRICTTCDTDGKEEKESDSLAESSIAVAAGRRTTSDGAKSSATAPKTSAGGRGKSRPSSSAPTNSSSSGASAQHSQSANATGEASTAHAPAGKPSGSAGSPKKSSQSSLMPPTSAVPETATDAGTGTQNPALLMPEPPSDISPRDRARLEQVRENAGEAAATTTDLPSAESSVADARGAWKNL